MILIERDPERATHRLRCLDCPGEAAEAFVYDRHLDLDRFIEYWLSLCPHLVALVEELCRVVEVNVCVWYKRKPQGGPMSERKEYPLDPQTQKMIDDSFTYHPPRPDQVPRYTELRAKAKELAEMYARMVPPGRERATALTHLQSSIMVANAGIACGEK